MFKLIFFTAAVLSMSQQNNLQHILDHKVVDYGMGRCFSILEWSAVLYQMLLVVFSPEYRESKGSGKVLYNGHR